MNEKAYDSKSNIKLKSKTVIGIRTLVKLLNISSIFEIFTSKIILPPTANRTQTSGLHASRDVVVPIRSHTPYGLEDNRLF